MMEERWSSCDASFVVVWVRKVGLERIYGLRTGGSISCPTTYPFYCCVVFGGRLKYRHETEENLSDEEGQGVQRVAY